MRGHCNHSGRLGGEVAASLEAGIFQRSNGNPLFMVNLVDDLLQQQLLVRDEGHWATSARAGPLIQAMPETLRSLISRRLESLSREERLMLESASALGLEFTAAAGIEQWPDGTFSGRYHFQHPLYSDVLYGEIGEARRVRLHLRIATGIETGYTGRVADVGAVLAAQFEKGRKADRAVHYRKVVAEQAFGRYAYPEVIGHLTRGLELIEQLPENRQRDQVELDMLVMLGPAFVATGGYSTPTLVRRHSANASETPRTTFRCCGA